MAQNDSNPLADLFPAATAEKAEAPQETPAWVGPVVDSAPPSGADYAVRLSIAAPDKDEFGTSRRAVVFAVAALTDIASANGVDYAGATKQIVARVTGAAVATSGQLLQQLTAVGVLAWSGQKDAAGDRLYTLPAKVLAAIG